MAKYIIEHSKVYTVEAPSLESAVLLIQTMANQPGRDILKTSYEHLYEPEGEDFYQLESMDTLTRTEHYLF